MRGFFGYGSGEASGLGLRWWRFAAYGTLRAGAPGDAIAFVVNSRPVVSAIKIVTTPPEESASCWPWWQGETVRSAAAPP